MLYIITAVHNRYKTTENFVKNLKKQTYQDFKLILVDDGSTDGTEYMVRGLMPQSVILKGDGNLWWGGAMHMAYKWLMKNADDDESVLIMNDDTSFEADFVEKGIQFLEENTESLITGCGFEVNSGEQIDGAIVFHSKTGTYDRLKGTAEGNCASTRALMLKVKTMKKTGGFHPRLVPHYSSDYEYTIRAARKGAHIKAFEEFRYTFDKETTGNHNKYTATIKQIFSKRSSYNPIYRFVYIFMVTPVKDLPSHIYHQVKRYKELLAQKNKR